MTKKDEVTSSTKSTQTAAPHPAQTLPNITNYKLLDMLGEGGFGVVYLADQLKPIKRKVALKVIKPGMDSKAVIARFEAERQALAMMNHPNVAKVFDAGTTEKGQPFFVMELVTGVSITDHCDRHKLNINERLNLFIDVCEAVQHAHQKGIIHRDIKPSNILVEYRNDKSICKVIDFGVAKAIEQRLTEQTIFTQQGQLIGTPAYMSPEQAEMTAQDIDTRSDIYSLGVVLYQLLTGVTPFETKTLLQAGWDEIRRVIREQEPQKPSTKLSSIGDGQGTDSATVARNRKTNPNTLSKNLRGDLDWVTIKALEKDRTRRYATATELADDLRRHLKHEPVLASPPGSGYRFKKFIRRNKGPVTAVAAVLVTLVAGLTFSVHLYIKAERARAETVVQRDRAVREAETAGQVEDFLSHLFRTTKYWRADQAGSTISEHERANRTTEWIRHKLADEPLVQARVFHAISGLYISLNRYDEALSIAKEALSISRKSHDGEHPDVARSINFLADVFEYHAKYTEAEKLRREALSLFRNFFGVEHSTVAENLNKLALVLGRQGKFTESERCHREALAMYKKIHGEEHTKVKDTLYYLAEVLDRQNKFTESEKYHREFLAMHHKFNGDKSTIQLDRSLNSIAWVLRKQGKHARAQELARETTAMLRKPDSKNKDRFELAAILNNRAYELCDQGKYSEALLDAQRAVEQSSGINPAVLDTLAFAQFMTGDLDAAIKTEKEAIALFPYDMLPLPRNSWFLVAELETNLAKFLIEQENFHEAERLLLALHQQFNANPISSANQQQASNQRIIDLYEAWHISEPHNNYDQKSDRWRSKLKEKREQ